MSNGAFDFMLITAERAFEIDKGYENRPLLYWQQLARKNATCEVCGQPAWRYADTGLCFGCTTGESDASSDYELV